MVESELRTITFSVSPETPIRHIESLLQYGAQRGLVGDVQPPLPEPLEPSAYPMLSQIASPDDYLGREHFEEYAELNPKFEVRQAPFYFNNCVREAIDDGPMYSYFSRHVDRVLTVKSRESVGLMPYAAEKSMTPVSRACARYAIAASSLVEVLGLEPRYSRLKATPSDRFIDSLATQLQKQFQS